MSPRALQECLESDTIQGFVEGWIGDEAHGRVRRHIEQCTTCRDLVVEAARACGHSMISSEPPLQRGARVERYTITDLIGSGGMGAVYQAYDAQLHRKVALKLLRPDRPDPASSATWQARLLREARAMAQLSHPNVVHVYDVGELDGQVFVAMELVEGETLRQWLRRPGRTTPAILQLFIDAGRGLAAAHEAGLVHRDFKPDNVLIGRDGRARVTDFGVARGFASDAPDEHADKHAISVTITVAGAVVGTPAYMAPEQFLRHAVDARADQFSFCVALYEGLYGARPFRGTTLYELQRAVLADEVATPSRDGDPRVFEIVRRGLRSAPGDRYEAMTALLHELERVAQGPIRRPRRRALVGAVAGAVVTSLGLLTWSWMAGSSSERAVGTTVPAHAAPPSLSPLPTSPPVATTVESAPSAAPQRPKPTAKKATPARRPHRGPPPPAEPISDPELMPFVKK